MSRKFNKNSQNSRSLSMGSASAFAASARIVGLNVPFKLTQASSGVGCISSNNTGPTLTSATNVYIDPYTLGSRCALLAAEFAQWKVSRMTIQYVSDQTLSGVVNTQAGPGTTPSYGSRPFAMGWSKDPTVLVTTHPNIIETGGLSHNTCKDSKIMHIPPSPWLYTSTSSAYPGSGADLRLSAHGAFNGAFVDASTTAAATYGRFIICYDISFRNPLNSAVIGTSIPSPAPVSIKENKNEQKEQKEKGSGGWLY